MRFTVVAALLLGALACASADVSFGKPGTGRLTCILPIKQLRCIVDTRSGFVAGVKYGYGPIGEANVCSQGNSYQTVWDMSPTTYTQTVDIDPNPDCKVTTPNWQNATNVPTWPSKNPIAEQYLMPYGSLISQVLVLEAPNPIGEKFGNVAALAFRYTNKDLAAAFDAGCRSDAYDWAICGNADYARAYLEPGSEPAPGPVTLAAVYTSPLSDDDTPSFLGSFQAKCFTRGAQYLGGDPQTSSKFHILALKNVCFSKLAHVVPTKPKDPVPPRPEPAYDWDVPFRPCYWDKKDSKKSASVSCASNGAVIATGKYGAIYVDKDGHAYDWEYKQEGDDYKYSKVEAKELFLGTNPEDETADNVALPVLG